MTGQTKAYFTHEHGDAPLVLQTAEDADALIDAMLAEKFTNSVAALYDGSRPRMEAAPNLPDHELRVAIAPGGEAGGIRYAGGDTWDTCYVPGRTSEREEVFYNYMGHDEDWPRDSEVSIEQVRAAIKEFVDGGGSRPASFDWKAWPGSVV